HQKREGVVIDNESNRFVKHEAFGENAEINGLGGVTGAIKRDSFKHDWNKIYPSGRLGPFRLVGTKVRIYGAIVAKPISFPDEVQLLIFPLRATGVSWTSMIGNGQGETEIPVDPAKQVPRASKGF
ncbi:MAG: hypothetical protein WBG23_00985, partial [Acidobacteriaceae bacterium]